MQFLVFNIESLVSEKGKKLIEDIIKKRDGNVLALVDESTCIKNHKAKRQKLLLLLVVNAKLGELQLAPLLPTHLWIYSRSVRFWIKLYLVLVLSTRSKTHYANIERVANRQGQHYEKIISYKNLDNLSEKLDKFLSGLLKKNVSICLRKST